MSLSVALKNSVLLLLIILILHFLLKNALVDAEHHHSKKSMRTSPMESYTSDAEACGAPDDDNMADLSDLMPIDTAVNEGSSTTASCQDGAKEDNDLYEYVFGDTHEDKIRPAKLSKACISSKVDSPPPPPPPVTAKTALDTKSGHGDTMGNLIVGDYKNEKALNGGEVFDGLYGFDGNTSTFQEL